MSVMEDAEKLHKAGFNCAQSVLCACRDYTGLDDTLALTLGGGFGGGVRCGEICGAVSGGVMALGMTNPFTDAADKDSKKRIEELSKEYALSFQKEFGHLRCAELKGGRYPCSLLIQYAATEAEKMIKREQAKEKTDGNL